ncbi:MAG TPA: protein kinase [Thermoleophilaceae bacterium]|nr:protein kinase [Thermoleophilaceae bacterium]
MRAPERVAGRYLTQSRLGAGGMSTVYLATDEVLERPVAVKLLAEHLAEDEAFVARFRREALAVARLQHPNIVQIFDSGQDPESGRHFIVMEYVEGPSCAELLREHKTLDVEQAAGIVRDACHGLDYAHRAGVIHRDVKPGNLLVSADSGTAKLADFGIAKAAHQSRITQTGSVLGTAAYLSPEQAHGEPAGPVSDIYSLGVCAYQFLTGRLPHEYGSLTELALKQRQESVEPIRALRPEVPEELDRAVRVALAVDPHDRYGSALEFATAVTAGLQGETTGATERLETDSTQALPLDTAATSALPREAPVPAPPRRRAAPPAPRGEAAPDRAAETSAARARRRRRFANTVLVLAVLLAGIGIAIALSSAGGGDEIRPVVEDSVRNQVDALRDLIEQNSE